MTSTLLLISTNTRTEDDVHHQDQQTPVHETRTAASNSTGSPVSVIDTTTMCPPSHQQDPPQSLLMPSMGRIERRPGEDEDMEPIESDTYNGGYKAPAFAPGSYGPDQLRTQSQQQELPRRQIGGDSSVLENSSTNSAPKTNKRRSRHSRSRHVIASSGGSAELVVLTTAQDFPPFSSMAEF